MNEMAIQLLKNLGRCHSRGLIFVVLLLGCVNDAKSSDDFTKQLSNEQVAQNFLKIAFGQEFNAFGITANRIKKWDEKWRLFMVGVYPDEWQFKEIEHVVTDITKLTAIGLDRDVEELPTSSFNVFLVLYDTVEQAREFALKPKLFNPDANAKKFHSAFINAVFANRSGKPKFRTYHEFASYCMGLSLGTKAGILKRVLVLIPKDGKKEWFRACLYEEMLQATGLFNDSYSVRPSIFNDDNEYLVPTKQDRLFARFLYDKRIRPDATMKEVYPIIRNLLSQYRPSGER